MTASTRHNPRDAEGRPLCLACGEGEARYVALVAQVDPSGAVIDPHEYSVCRRCYLEQFAKRYPAESLPDLPE